MSMDMVVNVSRASDQYYTNFDGMYECEPLLNYADFMSKRMVVHGLSI